MDYAFTRAPELKLDLDGRVLRLCFPLPVVQDLSAETSKPLFTLSDWFDLAPQDFAAVLTAGLKTYQPEVTREEMKELCARLTLEAFYEVRYQMCKLNFPGSMKRLEEQRAKERAAKTDATADEASPNA